MTTFPLSAIVGQQQMQLALILNAIDPLIGGVLISGRRGTGKSTAARALPLLLPALTGVADCPYFCDPLAPAWMCPQCSVRAQRGETLPTISRPVQLVTLPLNVSEDRVAGSFDLATALEQGTLHFAPGLLAAANRGLLYIDEINLLNDHIADLLLDAAALGLNRVERDGISLVHPARFLLIGTMNPEEGALRPQLLDRIGLFVQIEDIRNPVERTIVVERRLAYDADPARFAAEWASSEQALRERIQQSQHLLPSVQVSRYIRQLVATLSLRILRAEGHRGDLVVIRTARALAAWEQRDVVERRDIEQAMLLAMPHRTRSAPIRVGQLSQALEEFLPDGFDSDQPEEIAVVNEDIDERRDEREGAAGLTRKLHGEQELEFDISEIQRLISLARDRLTRVETGRRFLSPTARHSGRSPYDRQLHPVTDVAFAATIRAAAPYQQIRGYTSGGRLQLRADDLRQKMRERKSRALLIFVVDGSDSVMARQLMARTRRVLLALLQHAYEKRDRVAMLVFRFAQGRVVLPPTRNFSRARRCVEELYVGGCTPLATGLLEGLRLAETERLRDPTVKPVLIVMTDGLANIDLSGNMRAATSHSDALRVAQEITARHIAAVMLDTNPRPPSGANIHPAQELALALHANYYQFGPLRATLSLRRG